MAEHSTNTVARSLGRNGHHSEDLTLFPVATTTHTVPEGTTCRPDVVVRIENAGVSHWNQAPPKVIILPTHDTRAA